jgi:hypothetical protein
MISEMEAQQNKMYEAMGQCTVYKYCCHPGDYCKSYSVPMFDNCWRSYWYVGHCTWGWGNGRVNQCGNVEAHMNLQGLRK